MHLHLSHEERAPPGQTVAALQSLLVAVSKQLSAAFHGLDRARILAFGHSNLPIQRLSFIQEAPSLI